MLWLLLPYTAVIWLAVRGFVQLAFTRMAKGALVRPLFGFIEATSMNMTSNKMF